MFFNVYDIGIGVGSYNNYSIVETGNTNIFPQLCIIHSFFSELNRGEDNAFNIEERIIWNPFLDGVKQFLNIISFGPTTQGNLY